MDETRYREAERRLWKSAGATPTEQRVHLKRHDVTVRIQEIGDGPPVLFLHAAISGGAQWITLAGRLQGFRCMLLDRPGCGLSDALLNVPDLGGLPGFADELVVDVMDTLGLQSAHLVSASFGGYFALRAASAHPERIDRIVQFGYATGSPTDQRLAAGRLMSLPGVWRLLRVLMPHERVVREMFGRIGHRESIKTGRITQEVIDGYVALLRHTDTIRNEMGMGRAFYTVRGINRLVLRDDLLARITSPFFYVWGENEPSGGVDTARYLVDRMPNAQLEVLPGAGHGSWLDDLDYAAKATSGFLSS